MSVLHQFIYLFGFFQRKRDRLITGARVVRASLDRPQSLGNLVEKFHNWFDDEALSITSHDHRFCSFFGRKTHGVTSRPLEYESDRFPFFTIQNFYSIITFRPSFFIGSPYPTVSLQYKKKRWATIEGGLRHVQNWCRWGWDKGGENGANHVWWLIRLGHRHTSIFP